MLLVHLLVWDYMPTMRVCLCLNCVGVYLSLQYLYMELCVRKAKEEVSL